MGVTPTVSEMALVRSKAPDLGLRRQPASVDKLIALNISATH